MATNPEIARQILEAFLEGSKSDRVFWTYGELATAIGRPGQQRILGGPLDALRNYCESRELPDVATVVVSKESLIAGTMLPSRQALEKYNGWIGLRSEQARVMTFDWSNVDA